jgi:hypothetical protein
LRRRIRWLAFAGAVVLSYPIKYIGIIGINNMETPLCQEKNKRRRWRGAQNWKQLQLKNALIF